MKKQIQKLIAAGFICTAASATAQPILTAAGTNLQVGDAFTLNITGYFNPGSAGANQTWDFSSLVATSSAPNTAVSVASTSYATDFPNANIAVDNGGGAYTFHKTTSAVFQTYGGVVGGMPIVYSDPEDGLRFPFTYNDTYADPWTASYSAGGTAHYRIVNSAVTADGYGTLIIPSGTFTNVARVHRVRAILDSVYTGGISGTTTSSEDNYEWYANGTHTALAASTSQTSPSGSSQDGFYLSSAVAGINEQELSFSKFTVFPDPAVNSLSLTFYLTENKTVEAKLFNSVGQQVQTGVSVDGIQGSNTLTLDIATLPEGIYFAQIMVDGNLAGTKRFVVTK